MAEVKKVGKRYRVVEPGSGKVVRGKNGKPVDGGGHSTAAAAARQVTAILSSIRKRRADKMYTVHTGTRG